MDTLVITCKASEADDIVEQILHQNKSITVTNFSKFILRKILKFENENDLKSQMKFLSEYVNSSFYHDDKFIRDVLGVWVKDEFKNLSLLNIITLINV